jgi:hypothetical protein
VWTGKHAISHLWQPQRAAYPEVVPPPPVIWTIGDSSRSGGFCASGVGRWLDAAAWASDPRRGVGGNRSFPRPAGVSHPKLGVALVVP